MRIMLAVNGYEGVFTQWLIEHGIDYKLMLGAYKNGYEQCFDIVSENQLDFVCILAKAKEYSQECILVVADSGHSHKVFMDGSTKDLGKFVEVPRHVAHEIGNYTMDRDTGKYYSCLTTLPLSHTQH